MNPTLIRATLLSAPEPGRLRHVEDGALVVDELGRIRYSGPWEALPENYQALPCRDLRPCWILPGLIDLHTHLPQYRAVARDGLELLPWLETHIFPAEARFSDPTFAFLESERFFLDQLRLGTTTSVTYGSVHQEAVDIAFGQAQRLGNRLLMGKVMMDCRVPDFLLESTATSLGQSRELCETWHGREEGRLQYVYTPRFAGSCTRELMAEVARLGEVSGAFIQSHLSESKAEVAWIAELFPEASSYTDVYDRAGLLGPRTLLGHGIHLGPQERDTLARRGTTIVHCPRSNAFLQSGIMPLAHWRSEGLSVGLGTDVAAGPDLSMWAEMGFACQASRLRAAVCEESEAAVDPSLVFHLATAGAARALGLEDRIGGLEPGMEADFLVVDQRFTQPADDVQTPEQVLARLIYREDPRMVRETYVRGRLCASQTA
jgi:guanine deaminase